MYSPKEALEKMKKLSTDRNVILELERSYLENRKRSEESKGNVCDISNFMDSITNFILDYGRCGAFTQKNFQSAVIGVFHFEKQINETYMENWRLFFRGEISEEEFMVLQRLTIENARDNKKLQDLLLKKMWDMAPIESPLLKIEPN